MGFGAGNPGLSSGAGDLDRGTGTGARGDGATCFSCI